jgi:hypothetical protein
MLYRGGVCKCPSCGSHDFDGPHDPRDETEIKCKACGKTTTVGEAEGEGRATPPRR